MSRRVVGVLILFVASEILGVLAGHWFFGIFNKTVPPAMITSFNRTAAHTYFLYRGILLGAAVFLWSLAVLLLAPLFRKRSGSGSAPAGFTRTA